MRKNYDDRVTEWFHLKNGTLIVKLENDEGIDDSDETKSVNTMRSHFGGYTLSHIKRLVNDIIR